MSLPYPEVNRKGGPSVGWFTHYGVRHYVHGDYLHIPNGYPALDSDDWIEYIPPDTLVERDGDLWWRSWSESMQTFVYTQITKGSDARRA
jgi:hypothetical protein